LEEIAAQDLAGLLQFDDRGLVVCVVQDHRNGEVLMVGYMNREAFERTQQSGELHLFSRSRQRLWHKGETSGNIQRLVGLRVDCDGDAVLALVEPQGPACHTGNRTCFYRGTATPPLALGVLADLERTIAGRALSPPPGSYTAKLLANPALLRAKVREEAEEVCVAAERESEQRTAEEAADLLYHLLVLLRSRAVGLDAVCGVLDGRRG
jgi:phosphoribosyl-ATP pyrophosphohydrolase/phosphoribosyl-AMP cyclohydrolase